MNVPSYPAELPRELAPGDVLGRYRVTGRLGAGGFGVVYEAERTVELALSNDAFTLGLGRVALKVIRPDSRATLMRALREADALSRVSDPHVVKLIDVFVHREESLVLVTELLAGETLREHLRGGPLVLPSVIQVGAQVASALAAAHAVELTHRDLNPSNVMIRHRESGELHTTIIDFGLAHSPDDARLTGHGEIAGTAGFVAPEVIRGARPAPSSDVFSAGALLYQMITGAPLYAGSLEVKLLRALNGEVPPLPPETPEPLARIVTRALSLDPRRRYTALQLHDALAALPPWVSEASGPRPLHPDLHGRHPRSATLAERCGPSVEIPIVTSPGALCTPIAPRPGTWPGSAPTEEGPLVPEPPVHRAFAPAPPTTALWPHPRSALRDAPPLPTPTRTMAAPRSEVELGAVVPSARVEPEVSGPAEAFSGVDPAEVPRRRASGADPAEARPPPAAAAPSARGPHPDPGLPEPPDVSTSRPRGSARKAWKGLAATCWVAASLVAATAWASRPSRPTARLEALRYGTVTISSEPRRAEYGGELIDLAGATVRLHATESRLTSGPIELSFSVRPTGELELLGRAAAPASISRGPGHEGGELELVLRDRETASFCVRDRPDRPCNTLAVRYRRD